MRMSKLRLDYNCEIFKDIIQSQKVLCKFVTCQGRVSKITCVTLSLSIKVEKKKETWCLRVFQDDCNQVKTERIKICEQWEEHEFILFFIRLY